VLWQRFPIYPRNQLEKAIIHTNKKIAGQFLARPVGFLGEEPGEMLPLSRGIHQ
jgi:hypothetical protein